MLNILLVDDETTEREGMKFLIDKYSMPLKVTEASNGKNALEYIKTHKVDILLTDVKMPFMDGLELAKETYLHDKSIKIIIFSAYGEFDYAKKALQANAVNYLLKPIEIDEFKKVMNEVIYLCNEEEEQREKRQSLFESDKKLLLYKILTSTKLQDDLISQLDNYNISINKKYKVLINIETQNSFFAEYEKMFLTLLKTYAPYEYEYVNFYPNASYLILLNSTKMNLNLVEIFANKLNKDMKLLANEIGSFIMGGNFYEIEDIPKEVKVLNVLRSEIYECEFGVLFADKLQKSSNVYVDDIENIRNKINEAIEQKNLNDVNLYIQKLLDCIIKYRAISVIYMYHIFYDLINKLYIKYGIYDKDIIHKRVEKVTNCSKSKGLEDAFREILIEIAEKSNSDIVDGQRIANKVIHIIQSEYTKDLSLEYIANIVNFTPAYLSYVFKKETGSNVVKYITDFRMGKAKKLLEGGNLKIVQVSKACGYENQSYFNRLFKNYYGVTPKQFRDKIND